MRYGDEFPKKHDLSSLRVLGTVGEPINPEAWLWYYEGKRARQCFLISNVNAPLALTISTPHFQTSSHWQQTVLCCGHVVADGDRRPHADAAARRYPDQTRLGRKCEFILRLDIILRAALPRLT
jgi:hypothetical protein